jgi:hypothetical protein
MCQRDSNRRSGKLRAEKTQSAFAEGGELPVPGSRRAEDIPLLHIQMTIALKLRSNSGSIVSALPPTYGANLRVIEETAKKRSMV